jgi:hypothetical protein
VTYGTNNVWIGYVYNTQNLNSYRGYINEGAAANANFDEDFGGPSATIITNNCMVTAESFSVRFKLTKAFANGNYTFIVGGDDGYRFSVDGGATWAINKWVDQLYNTTTYTTNLNGSVDMVLEYYDKNLLNRVSFSVAIHVARIDYVIQAAQIATRNQIEWTTEAESNIRSRLFKRAETVQIMSTLERSRPMTTAHQISMASIMNPEILKCNIFQGKNLKDGSFKYTSVALVNPSGDHVQVNVYPNPVIGQNFLECR